MKKLLLSFVAIICATTYTFADGDYVGPNIQWWYTDTKQLVRFTGYGPMYDYDLSTNQAPWWFVSPYYYELADGITTIGNNAFYGFWLKSFNFPSSLTAIGESAFMGSSFSSSDIILPSNLQTIGKSAFSGANITSVYIPAKVQTLGYSAFYDCRRLKSFTVASSNPYFTSVDGVLYNKSMTEVIAFPIADEKERTSYVVPDGVTKIGHYAFHPSAYYYIKLTSIELPRTLKEIDGAGLSCYEITSITCAAKVPPVATESSFYEMKSSATITVPTGKTAAYKAAPGWSKFTNYVEKDFPDYIDPDCNVPTNLHLDGDVTFSKAKVAWTAGNQDYFGIRYKKSSDSKYIEYPNRVPKAESAITLTSLEANTSYDVVVFGVCGTTIDSDTLSENSAVFQFTTAAVPAPQTKPTVENGWAYYGENEFAGSGELATYTYFGMLIPANTNTDNYLDSVRVYTTTTDIHEITLWEGGNTPATAKQVWRQQFTPEKLNEFTGVKLIEPLTVNKSKNLWVFCRVMGTAIKRPVAYATDVNAPNARWIGITGGENVNWMDLQSLDPELSNLYIAWLVNPHYTKTPTYVAYVKDLTATKMTTTSITLSWFGKGTFELRWRKMPETEWKTKAGISKKTYTITGLEATNTYEIQVRATYNGETTDWSDVLNVYIPENAAIDNIQIDEPQSTKTIIDGQLYIIHDGKMYNAAGMRVR